MKVISYILIMLLAMGAVQTIADEHMRAVDPAAELQDAALNYESAAKAHMTLANNLLHSRRDAPADEDPQNQRNRRIQNAGQELQAAEQLMHAAANFDHAERTWRAAAQATQEKNARDYFQRAGRESRQRATSLIRRAAALAEHAALEYAANDDLNNQSRASHRAGRIREQLAGRN